MENKDILFLSNNALYHPARFQINIPNRLKMTFE